MSDEPRDVHARPIVPHDWTELQPLLDQILETPPDGRAELLGRLSGDDRVLRARLAQLVSECDGGMSLLDDVAAERFSALADEGDELHLPEVLSDRYRIDCEIGRGGMARVYLANDTKHARQVAIKVIRPELSASLGHERFLREIDIAARLRHPNIVPLYDSGEFNGVLYFVMPFEDGRSLRDRLRSEGALPISDALSILRDVARALAHAHDRQVVHRDVKPDNVMLSGGAAVVTDFGIAKAVSVALTNEDGGALTLTGAGIGTPAYMAPEQATGDPNMDHRADIYSFGCLAFELLTGQPPFPEPTPHQIVAAHMTKVPRRVTELRADVPVVIGDLVAHCLEKLPNDRPQEVRELLSILDGNTDGVLLRSSPPVSTAEHTASARPRQSRSAVRWAVFVPAAIVLAVLLYRLLPLKESTVAPITLSILPFGNTAADTSIEFVAQSLADEVAASLMHIPGILIKSRAGARMYGGRLGVDVMEAGARLKADYVVTGVVRQEKGQWILSAELARSADGTSIWQQSFDISPEQQLGVVELISRALLASLRSQFPATMGNATASASTGMTTNSEAYRLYLRGQEALNRRRLGVRASVDLFRAAIREDSNFARAYSGLSMALVLSSYYPGGPSAPSVHDDVVRAARRALELAPNLSQPHVALGLAHQHAFQWDSAGADYRFAIERDARDVEALVQYGRHLLFRGRHEEGLRQLLAARDVDPASAVVLSWLAYAYYMNGLQDSALAEGRRAFDNDTLNLTTLNNGTLVLLRSKRMLEAGEFVRRSPRKSSLIYGYLVGASGDTLAARNFVDSLQALSPRPWFVETKIAFTYLALGDTARALSAFERATSEGEYWPSLYAFDDPLFDSVRRSPRYDALVRRVGLGEDLDAVKARR